ncbi:MAG: hypothetical protein ACE5G9_13335, partial [Nitrospinales bacterium]
HRGFILLGKIQRFFWRHRWVSSSLGFLEEKNKPWFSVVGLVLDLGTALYTPEFLFCKRKNGGAGRFFRL